MCARGPNNAVVMLLAIAGVATTHGVVLAVVLASSFFLDGLDLSPQPVNGAALIAVRVSVSLFSTSVCSLPFRLATMSLMAAMTSSKWLQVVSAKTVSWHECQSHLSTSDHRR